MRVDIDLILSYSNPLDDPPWFGCEELTPDLVMDHVSRSDFKTTPAKNGVDTLEDHARRIAYMVVNPDMDPIQLCLKNILDRDAYRVFDSWIIDDGNHRLYAAVLRGDIDIECHIEGSEDEIEYFICDLSPKKYTDFTPEGLRL